MQRRIKSFSSVLSRLMLMLKNSVFLLPCVDSSVHNSVKIYLRTKNTRLPNFSDFSQFFPRYVCEQSKAIPGKKGYYRISQMGKAMECYAYKIYTTGDYHLLVTIFFITVHRKGVVLMSVLSSGLEKTVFTNGTERNKLTCCVHTNISCIIIKKIFPIVRQYVV